MNISRINVSPNNISGGFFVTIYGPVEAETNIPEIRKECDKVLDGATYSVCNRLRDDKNTFIYTAIVGKMEEENDGK